MGVKGTEALFGRKGRPETRFRGKATSSCRHVRRHVVAFLTQKGMDKNTLQEQEDLLSVHQEIGLEIARRLGAILPSDS